MKLEFKNENGKIKKIILLDTINRVAVLQMENSKKQKKFLTVDSFNIEKETWKYSDSFDEMQEAVLCYYKKIKSYS